MTVKFENITNSAGEALAYKYQDGSADLPMVVFLGGFRSDMEGTKACFLSERCRKRQQRFLRFDYSGHGQSGGAFRDGSIGKWHEDAETIIRALASGQILLVGSSMGGWISLLLAARLTNIVGVIGIAAAPDFTRDILAKLEETHKPLLIEQGFFAQPSPYGDDLIITQKLLDDGETLCILDHAIDFAGPVTLIQGKLDQSVDWRKAERIKSRLENCKIIYIDDGDHSLSRPQDLAILDREISALSEYI